MVVKTRKQQCLEFGGSELGELLSQIFSAALVLSCCSFHHQTVKIFILRLTLGYTLKDLT